MPKDGIVRIEPENPNIAKFINIPESFFLGIVRKMLDLSDRCPIAVDVVKVHSMEEVYLANTNQDKSTNSVTRIAYVVGKCLEYNVPYDLTCYSLPDPRTQKLIHIITDAKRIKTNLEFFELNKSDIKKMEIFQIKSDEVDPIFDHLKKLYEIYAHNVTHIFNRFDLHMTIDLVFHSVLQFNLGNEFVHKGWLDVMTLGDTRCGKGFVSENLIKYYNQGEIVSGENLSFAGLVGGIQQIANRWVVSWGKIPLNHKRLVIIDESGEMDPKDFSRLSRIRSEGVVEITKIQSEKTLAMTRLIFLSNPRHRLISSYSFGIEAITDIVESAEDISRFDYVLIVAQNEVDINEINKNWETMINPYEELDSLLISWIWSRSKEQIIFENETINALFKCSIKLGQSYSPNIPLIQGENIRYKLARISAAIAGRLFSTDEEGENLIVKPVHVKAAYVFINMIYKKQSSGYFYYSQIQKQGEAIFSEKQFEKYVYTFEDKEQLVDYFLQNNYITVTDLSEWLNQPKEIAREIISKLLYHKCIQKKYTFYVKNQCFISWLRQHR